jgi:GT2 family glycosyltransferase
VNIPLVSVIIVNWNGADYLHACLSSLYKQTYAPIEIIIVDNASTDNSCQLIDAFRTQITNISANEQSQPYPDLKVIRNKQNEGFCRGNNQGIHESRGEFVLLLNADVILERQFIEHIVKIMQSDQRTGITIGKLLSGHEPTKIDTTGIVIYKNRRAFDRGQGEYDIGQYDVLEEVFGASGAACLYRRTMLEDLKYGNEYLDELFFAYKEDVDLSWRARLFGWKCVYTPDAVGWHYRKWGTGKRKSIPKWIRRHSLKNRYLMMLKNERWSTFSPHIFSIFWHELRSFLYILMREPYLFAVVGDIIRVWPSIMHKRQMIQNKVRRGDISHNIRQWFQ